MDHGMGLRRRHGLAPTHLSSVEGAEEHGGGRRVSARRRGSPSVACVMLVRPPKPTTRVWRGVCEIPMRARFMCTVSWKTKNGPKNRQKVRNGKRRATPPSRGRRVADRATVKKSERIAFFVSPFATDPSDIVFISALLCKIRVRDTHRAYTPLNKRLQEPPEAICPASCRLLPHSPSFHRLTRYITPTTPFPSAQCGMTLDPHHPLRRRATRRTALTLVPSTLYHPLHPYRARL